MGFIAKRLIKYNYDLVDVLVEDTLNEYFNVVELPVTLTQGRSAFKIFGSDLLKVGVPLKMELLPTIACYIILVSSLYYFVINKKGSYLDAFLLGFFIYGVYETTNMAIFKDWSYKVGLIDLSWGGFLFLITTYLYKNSVKYI